MLPSVFVPITCWYVPGTVW
ncbi:MAG: hypothetical protein ACI32F_02690 [Allobaculum sp.]